MITRSSPHETSSAGLPRERLSRYASLGGAADRRSLDRLTQRSVLHFGPGMQPENLHPREDYTMLFFAAIVISAGFLAFLVLMCALNSTAREDEE